MSTPQDKMLNVADFLNKLGVQTTAEEAKPSKYKWPPKGKPGVVMMPPPAPEPQYEYVEVNDSEDPDVGFVTVDENKVLTFHLPEGWKVKTLRGNTIKELLDDNQTRFDNTVAATVSFDPMNQRSCTWYSPGADHARDFGAELSTEYEFDRPQGLSTCSNPDIIASMGTPNPPCQLESRMAACSSYDIERWVKERQAEVELKDGSKLSVYVETARSGFGFRDFRLVRKAPESLPVVVERVSSREIKDGVSVYDWINNIFAALLLELDPVSTELVDVSLPDPEPEQTYVDYVLVK